MKKRTLRKAVSATCNVVLAIALLGMVGCTSLKPGADLSGADLSGKYLSGKDLHDANLSGADLVGANLNGAVLRNAKLSGADLGGANLGGADLGGADLSGASLSDSDLAGANLSNADLHDANLAGANLSAATLTGADFSSATLTLANLEGAIDLPIDVLSKAISQQAVLGEAVMYRLFSVACRGLPIPGAADLEPVSDGSEYVLLNEDGTRPYFKSQQAVTSIGSIRYVVCLEDVVKTLQTCDYGSFDVDMERTDSQMKIVSIGNGEVIADELLIGQGPKVRYCPWTICLFGGTEGCGGITPAGDLKGDGVPEDKLHAFVNADLRAHRAEDREPAAEQGPWPLYRSNTFDVDDPEWPTGEFEGGFVSGTRLASDGAYVWDLASSQPGGMYHVLDTIPVSEFYLTVDVEGLHGSQDYKQGLLFGILDPANYLLFLLNGNGQFEVWLLESNQWRSLVEPTSSSAISAGGANRLAVHAEGGMLAFYINYVLVGELEDSALQRAGRVGLAVELTQANDAAVLAFDNFALRTRHAEQLSLLESAQQQARDGEIDEATEIYEVIANGEPDFEIPAGSWNSLCWNSSLWGKPVLTACEDAVQLAVRSNSGQVANIRDSRGIARALTGDYSGAIVDFQVFVQRYKGDSSRVAQVVQREAWIAKLEAGQNPFDEATLKALREE